MEIPIYFHLARVQLGQQGPEGRLIKCESRGEKGHGSHYWRIKLDDGRWVRAERFRLAGTGIYLKVCRECELEFPTNVATEVICPVCDAHLNRRVSVDPFNDPSALDRIAWREEHQ